MLPIRWDPLRELSNLQREMDNLFRKTFGTSTSLNEPRSSGRQWMTPLVDTFIKKNVFHIKAELPGITKEDIDINVEGDIVTITGERKEDKETKEKDFYMRETHYGSFSRRLTLPPGAKTDDVHASYDNGILEITVPLEKKAISGRKVLIEGSETSKKDKEVH